MSYDKGKNSKKKQINGNLIEFELNLTHKNGIHAIFKMNRKHLKNEKTISVVQVLRQNFAILDKNRERRTRSKEINKLH